MIDISRCVKAQVVKALYDAAQPQGLGLLQYHTNQTPLTLVEAQAALIKGTYFDYLNGRVMKVEVGRDTLDPRLYDRDNGQGAAYNALKNALLVE